MARPCRHWHPRRGRTPRQPLCHGTAHETEVQGAGDDGHALEFARHDNNRLTLTRILLRLIQALTILAAVTEFKWILGLQPSAEIGTRPIIEKHVQPRASMQPLMRKSLGTDLQCSFHLRAVEYRAAILALGLDPFGYRPLVGSVADPRRHDLFQPAHTCVSIDCSSIAAATWAAAHTYAFLAQHHKCCRRTQAEQSLNRA